MKYSVFISYRRTGGDTANLIAEKLKSMGYSVFFDVESLRGGKFNEQLFSVIDKCTDFVVILPEGALDRCADKEDWVRKEVTYAMLKGKNIVPVMLRGFTWSNPMPSGMEELQNYQAVTASDHETFDYAMQRLASFLKAPKRNKVMIGKVVAIVMTVVAILGVLFAAMRLGARPACRQVGDYLAINTGLIHEMYETETEMKSEWARFLRRYEKTSSASRKEELKNDMQDQIRVWRDNTMHMRNHIPVNPSFTAMESLMLSTHGVLTLMLQMMPEYVGTYCDDLDSIGATLSRYMDFPGEFWERHLEMELGAFEHSTLAYYYAYLSEMSHLPQSAKVIHEQMSGTWNLFPTISENLSASEYDKMQKREMDMAEEIVHDYEIYIKKQDAEIHVLEERLDSLDAMSEKVEEMLKFSRGN